MTSIRKRKMREFDNEGTGLAIGGDGKQKPREQAKTKTPPAKKK